MSNDSRHFLKTIHAFVDETKANCELVVKKGAIDLLQDIIRMSPVGQPELWAANAHSVYGRETHNLFIQAYNDDLGKKKGRLRKMGKKRLEQTYPIYAPKNENGSKYIGGRFRGNWQVTFNTPATGELERNNKNDLNGSVTLREGIEKIGMFTYRVESIYFTNNVPYGVKLEFGHSSQAPNGIVRVATINAITHFENAAKEVKK